MKLNTHPVDYHDLKGRLHFRRKQYTCKNYGMYALYWLVIADLPEKFSKGVFLANLKSYSIASLKGFLNFLIRSANS